MYVTHEVEHTHPFWTLHGLLQCNRASVDCELKVFPRVADFEILKDVQRSAPCPDTEHATKVSYKEDVRTAACK